MGKRGLNGPEGRFVLHRFNGDEIYRLESAAMSACATATGVTLWLEVSADGDAIRRCEDTAELGMSPTAEVGIELPQLDVDQLVGREFVMPGTKDDAEDSCMSLLYYCEHQPLRHNKITFVARTGGSFWVRWTGMARDVNHYDGSRPPTRVRIEGDFQFADIDKWRSGR